jgi:hypothetical protein
MIIRRPKAEFWGGYSPGTRYAYKIKEKERRGSLGKILGPWEA